jgi:hypothetical protein
MRVECPSADAGLITGMIGIGWLFIIILHILAQSTNGLTKGQTLLLPFIVLIAPLTLFSPIIVYFFYISTLLLIVRRVTDVASWYASSFATIVLRS